NYDSPLTNSQSLGGQFTGGVVTWTIITDGGNILPNTGTLIFVTVTGATWSGPSAVSSPFLNITAQNKELLFFLPDIDISPLQVIANWGGNTMSHLLIKASANYPGDPVYNSWLVVLDTPNFS
ncbi:MAG: hypothetical protein K6T73_09460, partial [Candidatus Bathyarchaeota archaeon]|nr:hypothetical protein [Candidatus Bathyarchaeota archaeon]